MIGLERVSELVQVAWFSITGGGLGAFDAEQFWHYWRRVGPAAARVSAAHDRSPEAAFTAGLLPVSDGSRSNRGRRDYFRHRSWRG